MAHWAERLLETAPFHHRVTRPFSDEPVRAPSLGAADWSLQWPEEVWGRWYLWDAARDRVMAQFARLSTAAPHSGG